MTPISKRFPSGSAVKFLGRYLWDFPESYVWYVCDNFTTYAIENLVQIAANFSQ